MATSKRMTSDDGRAVLTWRRGIISDQVSLLVNNTVVEERSVFGNTYPEPITLALSGMGYSARLVLGWQQLGTFVQSWEITGPPPSRSEKMPPNTFDEPTASTRGARDEPTEARPPRKPEPERRPNPDEQMGVKQALQALGFSETRVAWDAVERAFRDLARRYHPDAYAAHNLPPEMLKAAESQFNRIKQAFEFLKRIRDSRQG